MVIAGGTSNSVNIQPDGRRAVAAYRRHLDLLLFLRACNRADRGEAGGPRAIHALTAEFSHIEEVLRCDPQALAPDVLTLTRMARAGIPLAAGPLLHRPSAGLAPAVGGQATLLRTAAAYGTAAMSAGGAMGATVSLARRRRAVMAPSTIPLSRDALNATHDPQRADGAMAAMGISDSVYGVGVESSSSSGGGRGGAGGGWAVPAEEVAMRLGVDADAWDPIVRMRSHEAITALQNAARTACRIKIRRSLVPLMKAVMFLKRATGSSGASGGSSSVAGSSGSSGATTATAAVAGPSIPTPTAAASAAATTISGLRVPTLRGLTAQAVAAAHARS